MAEKVVDEGVYNEFCEILNKKICHNWQTFLYKD